MSSETPLPCPFCGEAAILFLNGDSVMCHKCGAYGPSRYMQAEAWNAWNVRVPNPALVTSETAFNIHNGGSDKQTVRNEDAPDHIGDADEMVKGMVTLTIPCEQQLAAANAEIERLTVQRDSERGQHDASTVQWQETWFQLTALIATQNEALVACCAALASNDAIGFKERYGAEVAGRDAIAAHAKWKGE